MFLEAVHFLAKNLHSGHRPAPGRLVSLGLLFLTLAIILTACGNGAVDEATPTMDSEEITPEVNVTRDVTQVPSEDLVEVGRDLTTPERDDFKSAIDNSGLILSSNVDLTTSRGIVIDYQSPLEEKPPEESSLNPDNKGVGNIIGKFSLQALSDFGLIGAVAENDVIDETGGKIIATLYVDQTVLENQTGTTAESNLEMNYEPGIQIILLFNEESLPEEEPDVQIKNGSALFPADGPVLLLREEFGLPEPSGPGDSAFRFTVGSHRCYICPWFLNHCICFNCPHW